jgi:hypothetical protein
MSAGVFDVAGLEGGRVGLTSALVARRSWPASG